MIPWFETPIIYDVRAKPRNVASLTGTKGITLTAYIITYHTKLVNRFTNGQHYLSCTFKASC